MKTIVAFRTQKKEPKKTFIFLIIVAIISLVVGIVCLINPMKEESMPTTGIFLLVLVAIYIPLGVSLKLLSKRIRKVNAYPKEAVVIGDETLYILTNKLTKIPLHEIKKVRGVCEVGTGVFVRVIKTYGNLTIKTENQKYTLTQIADVAQASSKIKSYIKNSTQKKV